MSEKKILVSFGIYEEANEMLKNIGSGGGT